MSLNLLLLCGLAEEVIQIKGSCIFLQQQQCNVFLFLQDVSFHSVWELDTFSTQHTEMLNTINQATTMSEKSFKDDLSMLSPSQCIRRH